MRSKGVRERVRVKKWVEVCDETARGKVDVRLLRCSEMRQRLPGAEAPH